MDAGSYPQNQRRQEMLLNINLQIALYNLVWEMIKFYNIIIRRPKFETLDFFFLPFPQEK
jgi:hypothetical protein